MLIEKIKYFGLSWKAILKLWKAIVHSHLEYDREPRTTRKSLLLKLFLRSQSVTLVKTLTRRLRFGMMSEIKLLIIYWLGISQGCFDGSHYL